jgi:hypothetical protein
MTILQMALWRGWRNLLSGRFPRTRQLLVNHAWQRVVNHGRAKQLC